MLQLAGWGSTEEGTASPVLKWASQKYVDYDMCLPLMKPSENKFITMDKFCTKKINGEKNVCSKNVFYFITYSLYCKQYLSS